MVPFTAPPVDRAILPQTGAEWSEQVGFSLACVDGPDTGVTVTYTTTSVGGKRAHTGVVDAILARWDEVDDGAIAPVVQLKADSYRHKKYGIVATPIFELVGWARPDIARQAEKASQAGLISLSCGGGLRAAPLFWRSACYTSIWKPHPRSI